MTMTLEELKKIDELNKEIERYEEFLKTENIEIGEYNAFTEELLKKRKELNQLFKKKEESEKKLLTNTDKKEVICQHYFTVTLPECYGFNSDNIVEFYDKGNATTSTFCVDEPCTILIVCNDDTTVPMQKAFKELHNKKCDDKIVLSVLNRNGSIAYNAEYSNISLMTYQENGFSCTSEICNPHRFYLTFAYGTKEYKTAD